MPKLTVSKADAKKIRTNISDAAFLPSLHRSWPRGITEMRINANELHRINSDIGELPGGYHAMDAATLRKIEKAKPGAAGILEIAKKSNERIVARAAAKAESK